MVRTEEEGGRKKRFLLFFFLDNGTRVPASTPSKDDVHSVQYKWEHLGSSKDLEYQEQNHRVQQNRQPA